MGSVLASFLGAMAGQAAGGWLVWRYYLAPKFVRATGDVRGRSAAPARSQPTATTPGYVAHDVTLQRAQWSRVKKATQL